MLSSIDIPEDFDASQLSPEEQAELIRLLEEREAWLKEHELDLRYQQIYGWQAEFIASTHDYYESCLCAGNQIGKTFIGTLIDAMHLTGDYPEDWEGHEFHQPPFCWGLGFSMEKTRDLLQTALFGIYSNGEFQGGLVPKSRIISWESATGTPNAMRTVRVKHASGGESVIQFWSYSQGQHAIMGDVVDWFHIDEEPRDPTIRPQVLTRTLNGDGGHGGRGIYTFTPENGRTELVIKFMDDPSPAQFFMQKGWADAPHITEEKRLRMMEQYPAHQMEMRMHGVPMLGHGRIYDIADEMVLCDPIIDIPDHWFVINGMDFGSDHPQAHIQLLEDRDNDVIYITHGWKASNRSADDAWIVVRKWSEGVPVAWPHDGLQREKGRSDALQLKQHYINAGFKMLHDHATWPAGGNSVETGLYEILDRMRKGTFKISRGLLELMDEFRQYHRDDRERIVKVRDDLLDAMRYAYMMRRFAIRYGDIGNKKGKKIKFQNWG